MKKGLWVITLLLLVALTILPACQKTLAEFELSSLDVIPPEATAGGTVSITAQVKNTGGTVGTYSATLVLDGVSTQTKVVKVRPQKTETIAFTAVKDKPGTYSIAVNDLSGTFKVLKPANLIISNLSPTPFIATPEQTVTVSVDVTNSGEARGSQSVSLTVDGSQLESKEVTVAPGATEKINFTFTANGVGSYSIEVGALSGTLVVAETGSVLLQLSATWPELAQELLKLPDLKQIDNKNENALENIVLLASDAKNKPAIESMLDEGIKEKRKYCAPLEALLWIAYDRDFDKNNPLSNYSTAELVKDAWRNTSTSKNYTSQKWQDFNEVIGRLNTPTLVATYMNDNIHYDFEKLGRRDAYLQTPEETFNRKKGICQDKARLAYYLLLQNGYTYDEFDENKNNAAAIFAAQLLSGFPDGHVVCLYKQNDKFYTIDSSETTVIKGPFSTLNAAADATYSLWEVCGFMDMWLNIDRVVIR
jgi:hypothetical protein